LKHVRKLFRDRSYRYEQDEFAVEGYRVFDSVRSVKTLVLRDKSPLPEGDFPGADILRVESRIFDKIPENGGGQGVIAVCAMPRIVSLEQGGRYVYLDGLQDPGNMGTLIRTAAAFGLDGILLGKGCADPFAPKTVRSAAGAVFTIPLIPVKDLKDLAGRLVIAADMKGTPLGETSVPDDFILAVGSEGKGVSEDVREICGAAVSVPMRTGVESLNAAVSAAIILYELYGKLPNGSRRPASRGRGP
jgi:TrmH family RNA methyltransferase